VACCLSLALTIHVPLYCLVFEKVVISCLGSRLLAAYYIIHLFYSCCLVYLMLDPLLAPTNAFVLAWDSLQWAQALQLSAPSIAKIDLALSHA